MHKSLGPAVQEEASAVIEDRPADGLAVSEDVEPPPANAAPGDVRLRRGWTTGACATAAAKAAFTGLLTGVVPQAVAIRLPGGQEPVFAVTQALLEPEQATAAVVKDAGDDPDVTHGCTVRVTIKRAPAGSGISFRAGEGVGTVTLPGLPLAPGEPAINPKPRAMIRTTLEEVAAASHARADLALTIAIPGGEALAARTLNGRLGIKGGLSILGTTGVVIPYSCASWIHSIHRGVDVARAAGLAHIAATTGSTSEAMIKERYALPEIALIDMGDFAGGTLKYLKRQPVPRLTLAGGIGKLAKLAQGHLDLHSSRSRVDMERLAALAPDQPPLRSKIAGASTALAALQLADDAGVPLAQGVAERARAVALTAAGEDVAIEVLVCDREGRVRGHARGW